MDNTNDPTREYIEQADAALDSGRNQLDRGNKERAVIDVQISIAAALIAIARSLHAMEPK